MKKYYVSGGVSHIYGKRVFLHEEYVWEMLKGTHCFLDQLPHDPTWTARIFATEG